MSRGTVFAGATFVCLAICAPPAQSQASKQLDQKAKDAQSAQEKSWQQVDQINKETDQTNARLKQSRQETAKPGMQSGSTVTKTRVGVESPYRKPKVQKTVETSEAHKAKKPTKTSPGREPKEN
jgi:hypothetical protein